MIDDYARTMELIRKMEAQLPIPARPGSPLMRMLRDKGTPIDRSQPFEIKRVLYLGDEGGIMCHLTLSSDAKEVWLVSLTHLRIPAHHPLATGIRAYQLERSRRIAESGGSGEPSPFTVRPRKQRKR